MTSLRGTSDTLHTMNERDLFWMQQAYLLGRDAAVRNEVPVGALLIKDNQIVAAGANAPIHTCDPTAHAEVMALRQGGQVLKNYRLTGTTLYVTLEPCVMCVGAMIHARIERLVFGAADPKAGAVVSVHHLLDGGHFNHHIEYQGGVMSQECGVLLQTFFRERR